MNPQAAPLVLARSQSLKSGISMSRHLSPVTVTLEKSTTRGKHAGGDFRSLTLKANRREMPRPERDAYSARANTSAAAQQRKGKPSTLRRHRSDNDGGAGTTAPRPLSFGVNTAKKPRGKQPSYMSTTSSSRGGKEKPAEPSAKMRVAQMRLPPITQFPL